MNIRPKTLWRVPAYCAAASWLSFYLTAFLGQFFFVVKTVDAQGVTTVSADPVRSAFFQAFMFAAALLLGGLWAFRTMTKGEIALSAAIFTALRLTVTVLELTLPNFPIGFSVQWAKFSGWAVAISTLGYSLTGSPAVSAVLSSLAPFLFVPFGRCHLSLEK